MQDLDICQLAKSRIKTANRTIFIDFTLVFYFKERMHFFIKYSYIYCILHDFIENGNILYAGLAT